MSRGSRGESPARRTWPWPSGSGCGPRFPTGCCGRSVSGRPARTGLKSVRRPEAPAGAARDPSGALIRAGQEPPAAPDWAARELRSRYTAADLRVFTGDEASRFVPRWDGDPQTDVVLAWEM